MGAKQSPQPRQRGTPPVPTDESAGCARRRPQLGQENADMTLSTTSMEGIARHGCRKRKIPCRTTEDSLRAGHGVAPLAHASRIAPIAYRGWGTTLAVPRLVRRPSRASSRDASGECTSMACGRQSTIYGSIARACDGVQVGAMEVVLTTHRHDTSIAFYRSAARYRTLDDDVSTVIVRRRVRSGPLPPTRSAAWRKAPRTHVQPNRPTTSFQWFSCVSGHLAASGCLLQCRLSHLPIR